MSFPAYPRYKNSGIEWVGDFPRHWCSKPLFSVFHERRKSNVGMIEYNLLSLSYGEIVRKNIETAEGLLPQSYETYQIVESSDIVLRLTDLQNDKRSLRSGIVRERGIITSAYTVLEAVGIEPKFSHYLFRAYDVCKVFYSMGGGLRQTMNFSDLKWLPVVVPPPEEQRAIAYFLDSEISRIDSLIEEQQRLIDLLKEKRQAVISHAVTKGLDPGVPMKDSGVDWLGEVPAHWDCTSLRRVVRRIEQGWSPECYNEAAGEDDWGVLKAGAVNNGIFRQEENKKLPEYFVPRPELEVRHNDLIMCRASGSPELIGSTANVVMPRRGLLLSDKLYRIDVNDECEKSFYSLLLGSQPLRRQIELSINGAEGLANNLPQEAIKGLGVVWPPVEEQRDIVKYVHRISHEINELIGRCEDSIKLLMERRSALISAAVTGKIDVRDWQPPEGRDELRTTAHEDAEA